ncbi:MAG: BrxE family protein [Planctomycetota bacterium]|nr:BrxE family protein [Planctomycetota bacterium]
MVETIEITTIAKLRLVIARFGEMDRAKWWNTKGMLAHLGELAVSRGFIKTHLFARARAVFAVAAHRCDEVFNPPDAYTLWKLPADIEDQLEDAWSQWLEDPKPWAEFLEKLNEQSGDDLFETLRKFDLVSDQVVGQAKRLKRSNDSRSVRVPDVPEFDESTVALLAAAFSRGESGKLSVPYVQIEGPEA